MWVISGYTMDRWTYFLVLTSCAAVRCILVYYVISTPFIMERGASSRPAATRQCLQVATVMQFCKLHSI